MGHRLHHRLGVIIVINHQAPIHSSTCWVTCCCERYRVREGLQQLRQSMTHEASTLICREGASTAAAGGWGFSCKSKENGSTSQGMSLVLMRASWHH
jgi:hypothetical protein